MSFHQRPPSFSSNDKLIRSESTNSSKNTEYNFWVIIARFLRSLWVT